MESPESLNPTTPGNAMAQRPASRATSSLDGAVDAILEICPGGKLRYFNRAAEAMFGLAACEIVGQPISKLFSPASRAVLDCYLAEFFSRSDDMLAGIGREIDGRRGDGSEFPLWLAACERQLDHRTFTAVLRDDAERRGLQAKLHRSRNLLDAVTRVQALAITDRGQRVVFDELLQVLLQATESQIGFIGEILYDDGDAPCLKSYAISNIARNEETRALYRQVADGDLESHHLDTLFGAVMRDRKPVITNDPASDLRNGGLPLGLPPLESFMGLPFFGNDRLLGMVGVANRPGGFDREVAEFLEPLLGACACVVEGCRMQRRRRETERELRAARDAAESANRAKSDFLAAMSHEIRTPMTAILGFAEIIIDSNSHPQTLDAAKTIKGNGKHLLELVNDLLDLSKIEAGKFEVELIATSPTQVVNEVATLMRIRALEKNLSLEIDFDSGLPEIVLTDPRRVRQVLINLVGNAIKFSDSGKVRLHTSWSNAAAEPGKLKFQVVDQGIGMTPGQISKLFRPFVQAEISTARRFGGTGLGLAISKRLVESLGGGITVKSSPGKGSTFTATIAAPAVDSPSCETSTMPNCAGEAVDKQQDKPLLGRRILLAEDGFDNQRMISFILKNAGATVVFAENGRIAVDLALAALADCRPFDVILMDLQMPEMDGYEATRRLRTEDFAGPIIALSAHAMADHRARALEVGCNGYASKPIDPAALTELVANYIQPPSGEVADSTTGG